MLTVEVNQANYDSLLFTKFKHNLLCCMSCFGCILTPRGVNAAKCKSNSVQLLISLKKCAAYTIHVDGSIHDRAVVKKVSLVISTCQPPWEDQLGVKLKSIVSNTNLKNSIHLFRDEAIIIREKLLSSLRRPETWHCNLDRCKAPRMF